MLDGLPSIRFESTLLVLWRSTHCLSKSFRSLQVVDVLSGARGRPAQLQGAGFSL